MSKLRELHLLIIIYRRSFLQSSSSQSFSFRTSNDVASRTIRGQRSRTLSVGKGARAAAARALGDGALRPDARRRAPLLGWAGDPLHDVREVNLPASKRVVGFIYHEVACGYCSAGHHPHDTHDPVLHIATSILHLEVVR